MRVLMKGAGYKLAQSLEQVMSICLISPPTVTDFEDPEIAESDAIRLIAEHAPVGILSLASVLETQGATPQILDLNRRYYEYLKSGSFADKTSSFCEFVAAELERTSFDIFGLSTICSSYPLTLRLAKEIRRTHPDATLILGGPQASVVDVETLKSFEFIDCVVRGEAEDTLPMVLDAVAGGKPKESIPGITFRKGNEIIRTPNASVILDMDRLPLPAFHLYPELNKCGYVPLELGRGCPFACTFCSTNDFFRRNFRLKSPQKMIEQMRAIRETYGLNTFDLIHDMFTVDRNKVTAFCTALLDSGEQFFWNCSARTDCIDEKLIELMASAGCRGIFFGIETGSEQLQIKVKKRLDLIEAAQMIECTDRHQITTAVSLITGFPEETMEDVADTVGFIMDSLRFDHAQPQLHLLAPLAETPIHSQYRNELIFDDIISDMSYQGWRQDPLDRDLIESYPEVFPNFYSVPTPYLDRQYLKELREFVLNSIERCRWLIVALHQNFGHLCRVFEEFREWRRARPEVAADHELSRYYADRRFRDEFFEFVRLRYAVGSSKVARIISTLINYERSLDEITDQPAGSEANLAKQTASAALSSSTVPRLADGMQVTELELDYKRIIRRLRKKGNLRTIPPGTATLITRHRPDKTVDVVQLSPLSAKLVHLCDGVRTIQDISTYLEEADLVRGVAPEHVCMFGLEVLRQEGLVVLS